MPATLAQPRRTTRAPRRAHRNRRTATGAPHGHATTPRPRTTPPHAWHRPTQGTHPRKAPAHAGKGDDSAASRSTPAAPATCSGWLWWFFGCWGRNGVGVGLPLRGGRVGGMGVLLGVLAVGVLVGYSLWSGLRERRRREAGLPSRGPVLDVSPVWGELWSGRRGVAYTAPVVAVSPSGVRVRLGRCCGRGHRSPDLAVEHAARVR